MEGVGAGVMHLSAATDETPMLRISQLSVTSLPRMNDGMQG